MAENNRTKTTTSSSKKAAGSRKVTAVKKGTTKKVYKKAAKAPGKRFGDSIYDEILLLVLIIVAILVLLSLCTSKFGVFGEVISGVFKGLFGAGAFVLPVVLIAFCIWMIVDKERYFMWAKLIGTVLFVIGVSTLFQLVFDGGKISAVDYGFVKNATHFYENGTSLNGGFFGGVIANGLKSSLGWGSYIVTILIIIISIMLSTGKSFFTGVVNIFNAAKERKEIKEAKIKIKAENIKEREEKYAKQLELDEMKKRAKLEKKLGKKKNFNFTLEDREVESMDEEKLPLDKDAIINKTMELQGVEVNSENKPLIDISGIDLKGKTQRFIEVLGFAEETDGEPIDVFSPNNEAPVAEDVDFEGPIIKVAGENIPEITETVADVEVVEAETIVPEIVEVTETVAETEEIPAKAEKTTNKDEKIEAIEIDTEFEEEVYNFPPIDLLGKKPQIVGGDTKTDMIANAKKLEETLASFGVEAKVVQINKGPTVTRYELAPKQGVKVSKIVNLADDIALNLAATGIRIEAPIPGKAAVGIEVPNREPQSVYLRSVLENEAFKAFPSNLAFALGEDIAGNAIVADIGKMPHLLIAGATGSGKSVCINTLITSILYKSTPQEVKLLLIDPKVVELSVYNGIPHLLIPVVTDPKKAAGALNWAVREMLLRYQLFAEHNVRDIKGFNKMKTEKDETDLMPQMVIVIDELADLMMAAPGDVEDAICRLAQMARAAGIHLIIATQRPSVDVITGVIKANIPSRLAFAVSSGIDSRTILDGVGAEKLLGKGDMLFYPVGMSKPVRIQGAFVTDKEVESIVEFVKKGKNTKYDQAMIETITSPTQDGADGEPNDEHYDEAVALVVEKEKASASMLQRQFRIGYNRAARLMDELEQRGIVGPEDGSKPRRVLINQSQLNEMRYPTNDTEE